MTEGFFLSHIKRLRKLYSDRREFFIEQFNNLLGDRFTLQPSEAGLHFVAWLRCKADFPVVIRFGVETGIRPVPLSFFCIEAELKPAFVFGFAAWPPTQIRESLIKFASALKGKRKIYAAGKQSYSYVSPCGYVENWPWS
jgi:GntR family transcriptional regulator/MocR family aminotransferase